MSVSDSFDVSFKARKTATVSLTLPLSYIEVHSKNGTRVGCGIIERVPIGEKTLLKSTTTNLTSSGVTSDVTVYTVEPDIACYFGMARNLEPNLVSFLNTNKTLMGMNCNFTNGCGVHIHNGTSCFNTTTQGGHYYNRVTYPVDPWLYTMYHATDSMGNAYYTGCAETGESDFINRPFVVHSNNGTRLSCGLLKVNEIKQPVAQTVVYRASIKSLLSASSGKSADGLVTIFTETGKLMVGYAGIVSNLEPNLLASTCNATNGCGVHIHSGRSCNNTSTQGGHFFYNVTVPVDPWINERYSSDARGKANFQSVVSMGSIDIEGRVFVGK